VACLAIAATGCAHSEHALARLDIDDEDPISGASGVHSPLAPRSSSTCPPGTRDRVAARFLILRKEYEHFTERYGQVLQDEWRSLMQELTMGSRDECSRYLAIERRIASLSSRMAFVARDSR
jgi:hypothetical protein